MITIDANEGLLQQYANLKLDELNLAVIEHKKYMESSENGESLGDIVAANICPDTYKEKVAGAIAAKRKALQTTGREKIEFLNLVHMYEWEMLQNLLLLLGDPAASDQAEQKKLSIKLSLSEEALKFANENE